MSPTAGKGKMIDSFGGLNRKRKSRPCGRSESNTYGVVSLASCSWDANESTTSILPPRPIGDDGVIFLVLWFVMRNFLRLQF